MSTTKVICRRCCGKHYRDVEIHNGETLRRDCGNCGAFRDFVLWHGQLSETTVEPAAQRTQIAHIQ